MGPTRGYRSGRMCPCRHRGRYNTRTRSHTLTHARTHTHTHTAAQGAQGTAARGAARAAARDVAQHVQGGALPPPSPPSRMALALAGPQAPAHAPAPTWRMMAWISVVISLSGLSGSGLQGGRVGWPGPGMCAGHVTETTMFSPVRPRRPSATSLMGYSSMRARAKAGATGGMTAACGCGRPPPLGLTSAPSLPYAPTHSHAAAPVLLRMFWTVLG